MNVKVKLTAFFALGAALVLLIGLSVPASLAVVFVVYLATGGYDLVWILIVTFPRDVRGLWGLISTKRHLALHTKKNSSVASMFAVLSKKNPNSPAFICDDVVWTRQDVENYSNKIANYFYEAGFRKGDVIALFWGNRPEYPCTWLGLSKIGVVTAMINFNLRSKSLEHCLNACNAKGIIVAGELVGALREVLPAIDRNMRLFTNGPVTEPGLSAVNLDDQLAKSSPFPPPQVPHDFKDPLFMIYTSGTTGLPKAAVVTHCRMIYSAFGICHFYKISERDRLYCVVPLYHSLGGQIGVGSVFCNGSSMVIKRKFSASGFWDDCVKYNCTWFLYIGEICRYLLAQPYRVSEAQHKIRLMVGNSLKGPIWEEFIKRYRVERVGEFYGATEGNASLLNIDNHFGAVGFMPAILTWIYPVSVIKVDEETREHVRDSNGLCIRAKPGEHGELIGKIIKGDPIREFVGYVNKQATSKKILHNVFKKGDSAFLTGDVFVMDKFGYMYFKDRTGDTFKWKGENVSTQEVEMMVSKVVDLTDCVAYGVEVSGMEGRAGMVAILDANENVDLRLLNRELQKILPSYARPIFVRLTKVAADTTGTFKLKKVDLRKESFNPAYTSDKLFYMDPKTREYEAITPRTYQALQSGQIRM